MCNGILSTFGFASVVLGILNEFKNIPFSTDIYFGFPSLLVGEFIAINVLVEVSVVERCIVLCNAFVTQGMLQ